MIPPVLFARFPANDETLMKAIAAGAIKDVEEAAPPSDFIIASRIVHQGSVWASWRVLSRFVEKGYFLAGRIFPAGRVTITDREKDVFELLIVGRPINEICSAPYGCCTSFQA